MTVLSTAVVSSLAITDLPSIAVASIAAGSDVSNKHADEKLIALWSEAKIAIEDERRTRSKVERFDGQIAKMGVVKQCRPGSQVDARLWRFICDQPGPAFLDSHVDELAALPLPIEDRQLEARRQQLIGAQKRQNDYAARPQVRLASKAAEDADIKAYEILRSLAGTPALSLDGLRIKAEAIKWLRNGSFDVEIGRENWDEPVIASLLRDLLPNE